MIFSVLPTPLTVAGVWFGRPAIRVFRIAKAPGDWRQETILVTTETPVMSIPD